MRSASRRPTSWPSCVEWWRDTAAVAVFVLLVSGQEVRAAGADDPKAVAREALSSLLLGNASAFVSVTLPVDGVQAILRPSPPSGEERARQVPRLHLQPPSRQPTGVGVGGYASAGTARSIAAR